MKLAPLEDHSALGQVPGTILLSDNTWKSETHTEGLGLKRNTKGDIILSPQPSEDPNDPLNWPTYKKLTIVVILMLGACLCASTIGPLLSPALYVLAAELQAPLTDITVTTGYLLLVAGCSGPFISALGRKLGKRPAFLFCSLMGVIGSIIGAVINTYKGLLAARIVQGFAVCAYESLIINVVGDMYFVHQRGIYSSVMLFTLNCVSNLSPIVCGPITTNLGWRYLFILLAVIIGIQFILCFLFVPETTYHRDQRYNTDETANTNLQELAKIEHEHKEVVVHSTEDTEKTSHSSAAGFQIPKKKTWIQEMKVYNGIMSDESVLAMLVAPFISVANLVVLWMVIVTGGVTSFYVAASYIVAQVFSPPPYLLSASAVGYTFLGPFIGGIIATLIVGVISDFIAMRLMKANKGVYEPEFRLIPMVFGLLAGAGFVGFGYVMADGQSVYIASFLWGLSLFGVSFIVVPATTYIIDAYRDLSYEAFIAAMMAKNFIFYGYSTFMNAWTATKGPGVPFYVFGGVSFGLALTTVFVFIWGKRYRSFWHRHNVFTKLHIRSNAE